MTHHDRTGLSQKPINLDSICVAVNHGCMGLPQELVDHVIRMLHDDLPALKACSLTCKAMFASTRHLIHQILYLTPRNYEGILIGKEEFCDQGPNNQLHFLSYVGERGLLRYARQVYIHNAQQDYIPTSGSFTPGTLLPHLHHFWSLDRVSTLIIERYDADLWANHYKSAFIHFYPTLTSLTLRRPSGHHRALFRFILQFPNLQCLCLEWSDEHAQWIRQKMTAPAFANQSLTVREHLRIAHIDDAVLWPIDFTDEIQNRFNFRSVELEDSFGIHGGRLLDTCARTVEYLTIVPGAMGMYRLYPHSLLAIYTWLISPPTGSPRFGDLELTELTSLRRLTFRQVFDNGSAAAPTFLPIVTITSSLFSEFVLELGRLPPYLCRTYWREWGQMDRILAVRFAIRRDFRFIIRTGKLDAPNIFQGFAKEGLPFLARLGCIHFETSDSVDIFCR